VSEHVSAWYGLVKAMMHIKENIWLKKEIGEYDDENRNLISFLNFHELLGNISAVCVYISYWGRMVEVGGTSLFRNS
jgi:hypothetical protein